MAKRLRDVCGLPEREPLWISGVLLVDFPPGNALCCVFFNQIVVPRPKLKGQQSPESKSQVCRVPQILGFAAGQMQSPWWLVAMPVQDIFDNYSRLRVAVREYPLTKLCYANNPRCAD